MVRPATPPTHRPGRLLWLDLFRGLAVFGMLDTHITNALVRTPAQLAWIEQLFESLHERLFNLPAPAFLFAAGISFGISVEARWKGLRSWDPVLRNRLARLAEILLLGFLLHVPRFSLRKTFFEVGPAQFHAFLNMDVLQCIAVSLFLLLVLVWLNAKPRGFLYCCAAAAALVSLATPWIWNASAGFPWWIGTYVSKHWESFFPLFPYAGFVFAGAAWGYFFAEARQRSAETKFWKRTTKWGIAIMLASAALAFLPLPSPYDNFWNGSPQFFFLRVGFFATALAPLQPAASKAKIAGYALEQIGRESLVVYIAHLVVIYGSLINPNLNLQNLLGKTLSYAEWFALYALLTASVVLLAREWSLLKQTLAGRLETVEWAVAAGLGVVFVIR